VIYELNLTQICEMVLYRTEILSRQDKTLAMPSFTKIWCTWFCWLYIHCVYARSDSNRISSNICEWLRQPYKWGGCGQCGSLDVFTKKIV